VEGKGVQEERLVAQLYRGNSILKKAERGRGKGQGGKEGSGKKEEKGEKAFRSISQSKSQGGLKNGGNLGWERLRGTSRADR